jgi:hypothetical protein
MKEIQEVHRKINAIETALRDVGSTQLISPTVKDVGIEQAHRAIIDCLKAIAEALEKIQHTHNK